MRIQEKYINLISILLGFILFFLGIILTVFHALGRPVSTGFVIDITLFYSILANIGIGAILFGFKNKLKAREKKSKSLIMIALGILLTSLFLIIMMRGIIFIDSDLRLNFIPYFISGILLFIAGIIIISKELNSKRNIPNLELKISLVGGIIFTILGSIFSISFYFLQVIFPIMVVIGITVAYYGLRFEERKSMIYLAGGISTIIGGYIISYIFNILLFYSSFGIFLFDSPKLLIGGLIIIGSISEIKFQKFGTSICLISLAINTILFFPLNFYSFYFYIPSLLVLIGVVLSLIEILPNFTLFRTKNREKRVE
ncbi:MAG: hypothetical protein ACXABO_18695 [Promethearchaeota archaeon]|jgi:hypothetical protein